MKAPDYVVVGGGIAGGAFATVMARTGASVLVLERQEEYRDRIRGELLWPWGVAEIQRLGLDGVLLDAGAHVADRMQTFDEALPAIIPTQTDLDALIPGVGGSMNLFHPSATRALADAAEAAGARLVYGAHDVRIDRAPSAVAWTDADGRHELRCGLIVGADGRSSTVRSQAGIQLQTDPTAHLAVGMLVDGIVDVDDRADLAVRGGDLLFLSFPQGGGRARVYYCMPTEQRDRFAGREAAQRFLAAAPQVPSLPDPDRWSSGIAAGPCATFACEDAWADRPIGDGLVLIGDAGGYNNPLIGQGLSLAVRDAGRLCDLLLADPNTQSALERYAVERTERTRRARIACLMDVWVNDGFRVQDPSERTRRYERIEADDVLKPLSDGSWLGFESLPSTPADEEVRERLFTTG